MPSVTSDVQTGKKWRPGAPGRSFRWQSGQVPGQPVTLEDNYAPGELLAELRRRGAKVHVEGDRLMVGPAYVIGDLRESIAQHKAALIALLTLQKQHLKGTSDLDGLPSDHGQAALVCLDKCEAAWNAGDVALADLWSKRFHSFCVLAGWCTSDVATLESDTSTEGPAVIGAPAATD